jgi:hypothetical protein
MSELKTKISTPELVRFSYVNLETAKCAPGSTIPKFGMSVIIPKANKKTIRTIEDAIEAAIVLGKEKHGSKFGTAPKFKLPLRDGDEEREDTAYAKSVFLNANSNNRPGMVDKKVQPILDLKEIKSGDWGNVSLNFYPFNVGTSSGVAVGLNHVQKVKDGEPLGGFSTAEDEFDEIEFDDSNDIM